MIPGNSFTATPYVADYDAVYGLTITGPICHFKGGRAISDTTDGRKSHNWSVYVSNGNIILEGGAGNISTSILFIGTTVDHISCAFDTNMAPIIAWQIGNKTFLRYFYNNGTTNLWTVREIDGTTSCRVLCDELEDYKSSISDVILFYTTGQELRYLVQRELYNTTRIVGQTAGTIRRAGRNVNGRLQIEILN